MNKLLLNHVIEIKENGVFLLEVLDSSSSFSIEVFPYVDAKILIIGNGFREKVGINILEKSKLSLEVFGISSNFLCDIHLVGYEAEVNLIYSALTNDNKTCGIKIYHDESNTKSYIMNHVAHYGVGTALIQVDGYIPKGFTGCSMVQDNKIMLMGNGKGKILPNLYISEFDSFSEHSAYISKFSKEEMFYLNMRGIDVKTAANLLKKAFLLGGFSIFNDIDATSDIKSKLIYTIQEFGGDVIESR